MDKRTRMIIYLTVLTTLLVHGAMSEQFTTPITTIDSSMCYYNGRYYADGEDIERDPENCYGTICNSGYLTAWDAECFFRTIPCDGIRIDVPGQCCDECVETTTPQPPTTPSQPPGCYENGFYYPLGAKIPQTDPCKSCKCVGQNDIVCSIEDCGRVRCVNPEKKEDECCPTCPDGPNCWFGKRQIKVGEVYRPIPNMECSCSDPWDPLACCKKLPRSKSFLMKKLRPQPLYMNPILEAYIRQYLGSTRK